VFLENIDYVSPNDSEEPGQIKEEQKEREADEFARQCCFQGE
jgi:hypothetical protein